MKNRSTSVAGKLLFQTAKLSVPQNSDEIALVDDDIGLPDDGPEHQAQGHDGQGQRHPKIGIGNWFIQTVKSSNHLFSRSATCSLWQDWGHPAVRQDESINPFGCED